jgi:hypothetical protein
MTRDLAFLREVWHYETLNMEESIKIHGKREIAN